MGSEKERKADQYLRQSERAARDIAALPEWMQRNLTPTTIPIAHESGMCPCGEEHEGCPARVVIDTGDCDLLPGHAGPHLFAGWPFTDEGEDCG